jgi:hypothetical protein
MTELKYTLSRGKQVLLVWLFSLAILISPAYNLYLTYDYNSNPDCKTYLAIANGNFKGESITRRYRIIVPFAAKAIAWPIEKVYAKLWPHRAAAEWPLRMGFFAINLMLMATVGLVVFLTCKAYQFSTAGSFVALIAVLAGGRWGNLFAAIPITDSLYILVITAVVYAIKTKNNYLLAACIVIGPLAKESFIFIAPLIFIFADMHKLKQGAFFLVAGAIAFAVRYRIDEVAGSTAEEGIINGLSHIDNVMYAMQRIFSIRGLGELATVLGIFSFVIIIGLTNGMHAIKSWLGRLDFILLCLLAVMLLHAALSSEVARMLYIGSIIWALAIAAIWDCHPVFIRIKNYFQ